MRRSQIIILAVVIVFFAVILLLKSSTKTAALRAFSSKFVTSKARDDCYIYSRRNGYLKYEQTEDGHQGISWVQSREEASVFVLTLIQDPSTLMQGYWRYINGILIALAPKSNDRVGLSIENNQVILRSKSPDQDWATLLILTTFRSGDTMYPTTIVHAPFPIPSLDLVEKERKALVSTWQRTLDGEPYKTCQVDSSLESSCASFVSPIEIQGSGNYTALRQILRSS